MSFSNGAGARGAGIVDDDVDLAERLHRLVVGAPDVGRAGDVALDARRRLPRALAPIGLDRCIEGFAPARNDGDVGARGREPCGDGKPDPFAARR